MALQIIVMTMDSVAIKLGISPVPERKAANFERWGGIFWVSGEGTIVISPRILIRLNGYLGTVSERR